MDYKSYSMEFAGRTLTLEFGKYAQQAGGSAVVRYGDTVVLVNATASDKAREGVDFFPLTVDFEEKQYAVGKIPGGFYKREGKPTDKATLTCRLIDRPLRPLFNKGMRNDVQVVAQTLSVDPDTPPEFPAMLGSSIALMISNIPWGGPTAAVVVARVNGELIINPTEAQAAVSDMHVTVAGTKDAIMMVEAGAKEVSEDAMMDAILFAHESIKELVAFQEKITAEIGKPKSEFPLVTTGDDIKAAVREYALEKCKYVYATTVRKERQAREAEVSTDVAEHFADIFPGRESEV
ncbi:MAG: polyribonucleotide nucleotidyltransferase, partial [Clostridia bacterium]|nr:polyribonucleotide nucleotidyltransferase [Clostridia bacterium]